MNVNDSNTSSDSYVDTIALLQETISGLQNDLDALKRSHAIHVDKMKDCCKNDTVLMSLIHSEVRQVSEQSVLSTELLVFLCCHLYSL